MFLRFPHLGVSAFAACLVLVPPVTASAQSVGDLRSSVERVEGIIADMATFDERFLGDLYIDRARDFERRMVEGRLLVDLEQHDAAAILLMDLFEDPRHRERPERTELQRLLADSLYASGVHDLAVLHYRALLYERDAELQVHAGQRLLDIALRTGRVDRLPETLRVLEEALQGRDADDELNYLRGRALFHTGERQAALRAFDTVRGSSSLAERASYFAAVVEAALGDHEAALSRFRDQFTRLADAGDELARELRNLAALGAARVLYEQGNWTGALGFYGRVDADSRHFDRALYESSWTMIRLDRLPQASRDLEILALTALDSRVRPEALLLRGETELRRGEFDSAVAVFEEVRAAYEPIEDEVRDAMGLLQRRVREEGVTIEGLRIRRILSPRARDWLDRGRGSASLLEDLEDLQAELLFQVQLVEDLNEALALDRQIAGFPILRNGWNLALQYRMELVAMESSFLDMERDALWDRLSDEERTRYRSIRNQRVMLARQVQRLPSTARAMGEREEQRAARIRGAEQELFLAMQELEADSARLDAIEQLVRDAQRRGEPMEDEERIFGNLEVSRQRAAARMEVAEDLRRRLSRLRAEALGGGSLTPDERAALDAYETVVLEERTFLQQYRSRVRGLSPVDPGRGDASGRVARLQAEGVLVRRDLRQLLDEIGPIEAALDDEQSLTESERSRARAELDRLRADLAALLERLDDEVVARLQREEAALGDVVDESEHERTARVEEMVDDLILLERGALTAAEIERRRELLGRIDEARARRDVAERQVAGFFAAAQAVVAAEGDRLRIALDAATDEVIALQEQYVVTEAVARRAALDQALLALAGVRDRFADINLRANLGVLDVSWREFEEATTERRNVTQERIRSLNVLRADFEEILGE
ncbi:MAG: hypothetical protein EA398_07925 [Deltaproteobacteria bacterium]|nr:MAG: hypothetical protein EA398_07925 [Deltaproteobacteria bacterium]